MPKSGSVTQLSAACFRIGAVATVHGVIEATPVARFPCGPGLGGAGLATLFAGAGLLRVLLLTLILFESALFRATGILLPALFGLHLDRELLLLASLFAFDLARILRGTVLLGQSQPFALHFPDLLALLQSLAFEHGLGAQVLAHRRGLLEWLQHCREQRDDRRRDDDPDPAVDHQRRKTLPESSAAATCSTLGGASPNPSSAARLRS